MSSKPKVGILTSLSDFSPAYSLTGIIKDQARSFRDYGYDYDLITLDSFNDKDKEEAKREGLKCRHVLSRAYLKAYATGEKPDKDFEEQVGIIYKGNETGIGYKEAVAPYDVIITHDLMFLDYYLVPNQAVRKWLHWVHSSPSKRPADLVYPSTLRYTDAPNSLYVFLNKSKRQDLANMFLTNNSSVRVVYNPKDIRDVLEFSSDTREFIDEYKLFDHFILQTYAFSTPRWRDKGVHKLLKIFGEWKKLDIPAKLVLINSHCNQESNFEQVDLIKDIAANEFGLEPGKDVILSSDYADERIRRYDTTYPPKDSDEVGNGKWQAWKYSVPHKVVRDLPAMSNMFIFPSVSECCSLIQAEANVLGKFMVLNSDFVPMLEFCTDDVLRYSFNLNDPAIHAEYYECAAKEIISNFINDSSVINSTKARNETCNRDWIFKNQLEPILYERGNDDGS